VPNQDQIVKHNPLLYGRNSLHFSIGNEIL